MATHPKRVRTAHVDTSLQIERCKWGRKAKPVESALAKFGFISTSTFAKLEFKCAWLKDLAYLHAASQRVGRVEELVDYVNTKLNAHPANRRRVSRCLDAIISFLSGVPGELSYAAAFVRLRMHIANAILGAYPWWEQSVHYEYDGTRCIRAAETPRKLAGGAIDVRVSRCPSPSRACGIAGFFETHRALFVAIRTAVEKLGGGASEELQKACALIEDAEATPAHLCNDAVCRAMGDVLIAIDGIDMDCFAANNDKEWCVLAHVLSKELVNPVKPPVNVT